MQVTHTEKKTGVVGVYDKIRRIDWLEQNLNTHVLLQYYYTIRTDSLGI